MMDANAKQPNEILIAAVVMGILHLLDAAGQVFP